MRPRRLPLFRSCAVAVATMLAGLPISAQAVGFNPSIALSPSDSTLDQPLIAARGDQRVIAYTQSDGTGDRLYLTERTPSGEWTAPNPVSPAGESVYTRGRWLTYDDAGNLTVVWRVSGSEAIKARTRLAGSGTWSEAAEVVSGEGVHGADVKALSGGRVMLAYSSYHGGDCIRVRIRDANTATWGAPTDVDPGNDHPGQVALSTNAAGDATVVWGKNLDGTSDHAVMAARYDGEHGTWGAPATLDTDGAGPEFLSVATTPDGAATAAWTRGTDFTPQATSVDADPGAAWSTVIATAPGWNAILSQVASDRDGDVVLVMQTLTFDADPNVMYPTSRARMRTRDAETGQWSPLETLDAGTRFSGGPALTVNDNYDIAISFMAADPGGVNFSRVQTDFAVTGVAGDLVFRPDGSDDFTEADPGYGGVLSMAAAPPSLALDNAGNPAIAWARADAGTNRHLEVVVGDATAPEQRSVTVPESATTGEPVPMTADAVDTFAPSLTTGWNFGDGAAATGASVTHAYTRAATYTVTATSADLFGNAARTTREIVVTDPPSPPPEVRPPVVTAPLIEARLAGRTVTLNAKLTLRKGKRCSGTVRATTAFGGRTYRTTLRLATKNGACRATGTIKLKKTPSLRTKLRVTVSGGQAKSRTLTTRRG